MATTLPSNRDSPKTKARRIKKQDQPKQPVNGASQGAWARSKPSPTLYDPQVPSQTVAVPHNATDARTICRTPAPRQHFCRGITSYRISFQNV
eukprot:1160121-Pelagomonas_calceolata.AAC.2